MERGDEQSMGKERAYGLGDAVTLVAHHDDGLGRKVGSIDILAVEYRATNGQRMPSLSVFLGEPGEEFGKITIINIYTRDAAHRGLHHLGTPGVGGVLRAVDSADTEPVGKADDGAEVAGVLDTVQRYR